MKILISSMSIQYFQNYIRSFYFAKHLVEKGHQVTLLTAAPKHKWFKFGIENEAGVKVIIIPDVVNWRLRRGGLGPVNFLFRLIYILIHKFDIYHGDGHRPAILIPILIGRKVFRKPFFSEWMDIFGKGGIHDNRSKAEKWLIGFYDRFFETKTRKIANGSVVLSKSLYNRVANLAIEEKNILLLHGGADISNIKVLPLKESRKKLNLSLDKFIFGLVGINKDDLHDLDILFEAIRQIDFSLRMKIFIITTGSLQNFDLILKEKKLSEHFYHFGWIDRKDYNSFLCSCDVMIMPMKDNERNRNKWPMKFGDFLAAGRPVISNPVGDTKDYFEKKEIGFLINNTASDFKNTIEFCLKNINKVYQFGLNARVVAEEEISYQAQTDKLINFYSKFLQNSNIKKFEEGAI